MKVLWIVLGVMFGSLSVSSAQLLTSGGSAQISGQTTPNTVVVTSGGTG